MMNHNNRVIYIGLTNDILRRVHEHRMGKGSVFTRKYKINKLVYVEEHVTFETAQRRESQMKQWNRDWKIQLIEKINPEFEDMTSLLLTEAR